jgi:flagellar P-ring protein precursor FlgI
MRLKKALVMKKFSRILRPLLIVAAAFSVASLAQFAEARTQLKNICRLKGQEENVLRGLGLVVGLNGTGESNDPATMRAISQAMRLLGDGEQGGYEELKKIKNVSMVMVTATIPATGARRGDKIDCSVSAMNGKSLVGGRLAFASLVGPNTNDPRVYGLCEGLVVVDDAEVPTGGTVVNGCQLEADIFTPFYSEDGFITLILDRNHANFQTAALIAETINSQYRESLNYAENQQAGPEEDLCHARDAANIRVRIPEVYHNDPVGFASDVLDIKLYEHEPESRVVINPRAGSIVISGDVEIGDVVVSHKNIVVESIPVQSFTSLDVDQTNDPKLKQLVDQLNLLKVPTMDMIAIIRGIEDTGKLHGRLIVE